jgi:hypothetical protein
MTRKLFTQADGQQPSGVWEEAQKKAGELSRLPFHMLPSCNSDGCARYYDAQLAVEHLEQAARFIRALFYPCKLHSAY